MNREPHVTYATVRDAGDELHIECRFDDGQKFAAVTVDVEFPELATAIAAFLRTTYRSQAAPASLVQESETTWVDAGEDVS